MTSKAVYVLAQGQVQDHHCHWPGCPRQVPPAMWGCREHWNRLPKALRDAIWAAYVPGQELTKCPSTQYVAVAQLVQEWIAGRIDVRADGRVQPIAQTLDMFSQDTP